MKNFSRFFVILAQSKKKIDTSASEVIAYICNSASNVYHIYIYIKASIEKIIIYILLARKFCLFYDDVRCVCFDLNFDGIQGC